MSFPTPAGWDQVTAFADALTARLTTAGVSGFRVPAGGLAAYAGLSGPIPDAITGAIADYEAASGKSLSDGQVSQGMTLAGG